MNAKEAAAYYDVDEHLILSVCKDPRLSKIWGCKFVKRRWMIENAPQGDRWLSVRRVAEIMGKSPRQIQRLCKIGAIRTVSFRKKYLISKAEAIKLLQIRG